MAATIAKAIGYDKSGRVKETHRLGSSHAVGQANTWRTYATVETNADGSGSVWVKRDGRIIHEHHWPPEKGGTA